jgi:hypothetical protein
MNKDELEQIKKIWLEVCGACDAGVGTCNHPTDDYRPVMLELVRALEDHMSRRPVLQDWVCALPLRHQGVLCSAVRSCDTAAKPGGIERHLQAYLRFTFMVPADWREIYVPGAFMRPDPPVLDEWKASGLGHFPQHYYSHLMHAFQVVAAHTPDPAVMVACNQIYHKMVHNLHLEPELYAAMDLRLTEDRFISGTVVS